MNDITGRVLGVTGTPTQRGTMRYKVAFSDGNEYTTFDNDLAKKANGLVNQDVSARVNVGPSRDGRFTNYDLIDIAPVGQLGPQDMMGQAGTTVGADGIAIVQPQQRRGGGSGGGGRGMTEGDKTRITRLAALGTAFDFVGKLYTSSGPEGIEEAKTLAFQLAGEIYNKGREHEINQAANIVAPVVTTPQQIAAGVPGVQVGVTPTEDPGEAEAAAATAPTPKW